MRLSQHFQLSEFFKSQTAEENGIKNTTNNPEILMSLKELCLFLLEPARIILGRPLTILSGYRCEKLNKMVGGSLSSQHMKGQAADIVSDKNGMDLIINACKKNELDYDQIIIYPKRGFIHLSYRCFNENRKQLLESTNNSSYKAI